MELVRSKAFVLFVVLLLGVTLISSLNNSRRDHKVAYDINQQIN
jgi:hypothetical protein